MRQKVPGWAVERPFKVREVADALHCSERTVDRMCASGQLKAFRVGYQWRVWPRELRRYAGVVEPEGVETE